MRVRLRPVRELLAGMIFFPLSEAESVLRDYAEVIASAPEELSVSHALSSAPDGSPVVLLADVERPGRSGRRMDCEAEAARHPGHGADWPYDLP